VPELTVESVPIPYVTETHRVVVRPAFRAPYLVANRELGGDASGFMSVSLNKDARDRANGGVAVEDHLFTVHTREAADDLINALVRARNSAYPDSGSLATFQAATASPATRVVESPCVPEDAYTLSTVVAPRVMLTVDGIGLGTPVPSAEVDSHRLTWDRPVVSWPGVAEVPEPSERPQSEQPRREAALRRVIERELERMRWEGV